MLRRLLTLAIAAGLCAGGIRPAAARSLCFERDKTPYCFAESFASYWQGNGGLDVFGYPITTAEPELNQASNQIYLSQWAERNRFELHPENAGTPYAILLGLLGKDRLAQLGRDPAAEGREGGPQDGCLWFEQTGHNICDQEQAAGFKTYWESHGLAIPGLDRYARSLQLFGLPLTAPKLETNSSGDTVLTQWFERARFEWHPSNPDGFKVLLGLLGNELIAAEGAPARPDDWLGAVNYYRGLAGVAPVTQDGILNDNCFQHARYMAENRDLTHNQDSSRPWASPNGQHCAQHGNAWIGEGGSWRPVDAIDGWMESPGHRLWLIYPTTPIVGFGFYRAANGVSAAGLDVLTHGGMGSDEGYAGWPLRYPAANQLHVPPQPYPVTLMWRYFGDAPAIISTSLQTASGIVLPHVAEPPGANHKGVVLYPMQALPANAAINVKISGTYGGESFDIGWVFWTGRTRVQ